MTAAWIDAILDELTDVGSCAYQPGDPPSAEPVALAALALVGHGRATASLPHADWLAERQQPHGGVGLSPQETEPHWPTPLAILVWQSLVRAAVPSAPGDRLTAAVHRSVHWLLTTTGKVLPQTEEVGHDTLLRGWPWVDGTHSWLQPTAFAVLALRSTDHANHPRTLEARRLLVDRLLPDGGANCGNTIVLGQTLRPHQEPSGQALLALAGTGETDPRIAKTIAYLEASLAPDTAAASLAYALTGLAAHGRWPADGAERLARAAEQTRRRGASPARLALVALAALGDAAPWITLPRGPETRS